MGDIRFVVTSDLHGETPNNLMDGDFLLISGDLGPNLDSSLEEATWFNTVFFPWLESQPHRNKVIIAGNHDFSFERHLDLLEIPKSVTYLQDSSATIEGIKFYGSPRTPEYGPWAFMSQDEKLAWYWDLIPEDTDVLMTHGPAFGIRDEAPRYTSAGKFMENAGSKTLRERIEKLKNLKLFLFGHIHEGYGLHMGTPFSCVNGSYWDGRFRTTNLPLAVHIPRWDALHENTKT